MPRRAVGPDQVEDAVHALQVHGDALEAVGDLAGDRVALQAADLLEVGELGDFHAVEPDLPAETPGAQGGRFPVVLDKADIVLQRVDAQRPQGIQIELLDLSAAKA